MPRSPLHCFFTPLGSSRLIAAQEQTIADLKKERDALAEQVKVLDCKVMTSRETAIIQAREMRGMEEELAERDKRIARLSEELENATIDDSRLDEVLEKIEEFAKIKENYERRIANLKMHLSDARKALKQMRPADLADSPRPLELAETAPSPARVPSPPPCAPSPGASERASCGADTSSPKSQQDWLQQLPEEL